MLWTHFGMNNEYVYWELCKIETWFNWSWHHTKWFLWSFLRLLFVAVPYFSTSIMLSICILWPTVSSEESSLSNTQKERCFISAFWERLSPDCKWGKDWKEPQGCCTSPWSVIQHSLNLFIWVNVVFEARPKQEAFLDSWSKWLCNRDYDINQKSLLRSSIYLVKQMIPGIDFRTFRGEIPVHSLNNIIKMH